MKINLSEFEKSEKLKLKAKTLLNIPDNVLIDFCVDSTLALNQASRGIAELFPHKRSIATLGALPQPLNKIVKEFTKQGFSVQKLGVDFKKNQEEQKKSLLTELEGLKKDTLFVFASLVEPITALIYPLDLIREEILNKNIFIIYYQSPTSLLESFRIPQSPLECGIYDPLWGKNVTTSLMLKGERCQFEPLIWSESEITLENVELVCEKIKASVKKGYFEERILLDFEIKVKNAFSGSVEILPMSAKRINDRVVFFVKGVNGDALAKEMMAMGFECSTADADFWHEPKINSWLPELGFSINEVQTSFIMSVEDVQKPEAFDKLIFAIKKYQKISGVT
ncbi:MAG: hypothetical protein IPM57_01120 [Oligoflexia bacterium]|nr:hypothetical protein [Oligoflexia bacterium]